MLKKGITLAIVAVLCIGFSSCAIWRVWKSSTFESNNEPFFDATLTTKDFVFLQLEVTNKTNENIEIIWPKTNYIDASNATNGGFMSGQEVYWEDKDKPINPTIIFPNTKAVKNLYPSVLADWRRRAWNHNWLPLGINGISLTVKVGNQEISRQMIINVVEESRF